jgi:hypothetical protein
MRCTILGVRLGLALGLAVALVAAPAAFAGETRTETNESQVGNTKITEETTYENFGTADEPDWKRVETRTTSETPDPNDSTTIERTIETRKYEGGSRRATRTTTVEETEGLIPGWDRVPKKRKTRTTTYGTVDGHRKKTETVVETFELVEIDDHGVPIGTGRRVTTTRGPPKVTKVEVLGRDGQWREVAEGDGEKSTSDAKPPGRKPPLDAQRQGLPTANPGQRGMIPQGQSQGGKY